MTSKNPMWRQRCGACDAVVAGAVVIDGDEAAAVLSVSGGRKKGDGSVVERVAPGDPGHPVTLDALCVHLGGTYDPNQGDLFAEATS